MRYWFDTEFIEDGKTIELISIGVVSEDNRELYLENVECDTANASQWVRDNVLPYIGKSHHHYATRKVIKESVLNFCGSNKPEFWAYYADYDWVALCQLFGTMMDLPQGWPRYCRDIKQWCDMLGNPRLPKQEASEHHALSDARWNRAAWEFLRGLK